jgi:hypothetical protein
LLQTLCRICPNHIKGAVRDSIRLCCAQSTPVPPCQTEIEPFSPAPSLFQLQSAVAQTSFWSLSYRARLCISLLVSLWPTWIFCDDVCSLVSDRQADEAVGRTGQGHSPVAGEV